MIIKKQKFLGDTNSSDDPRLKIDGSWEPTSCHLPYLSEDDMCASPSQFSNLFIPFFFFLFTWNCSFLIIISLIRVYLILSLSLSPFVTIVMGWWWSRRRESLAWSCQREPASRLKFTPTAISGDMLNYHLPVAAIVHNGHGECHR